MERFWKGKSPLEKMPGKVETQVSKENEGRNKERLEQFKKTIDNKTRKIVELASEHSNNRDPYKIECTIPSQLDVEIGASSKSHWDTLLIDLGKGDTMYFDRRGRQSGEGEKITLSDITFFDTGSPSDWEKTESPSYHVDDTIINELDLAISRLEALK